MEWGKKGREERLGREKMKAFEYWCQIIPHPEDSNFSEIPCIFLLTCENNSQIIEDLQSWFTNGEDRVQFYSFSASPFLSCPYKRLRELILKFHLGIQANFIQKCFWEPILCQSTLNKQDVISPLKESIALWGMKTWVTKLLSHRVTSAVRRRGGTRHRKAIKSERSIEEKRVILEGLGMHHGSVAISVSSGASSVLPAGKIHCHGLDISMQGRGYLVAFPTECERNLPSYL